MLVTSLHKTRGKKTDSLSSLHLDCKIQLKAMKCIALLALPGWKINRQIDK